MKKCTRCGAEMPEEAVFCANCGTSVDEKTEQNAGNVAAPKLVKKPIAALVLSIVALIVGVFSAVTMFAISGEIQGLITYTMIPTVAMAVVSIALASRAMAFDKSKMAIASIVLSALALASILVTLFFYSLVLLFIGAVQGGGKDSSSSALRMLIHF